MFRPVLSTTHPNTMIFVLFKILITDLLSYQPFFVSQLYLSQCMILMIIICFLFLLILTHISKGLKYFCVLNVIMIFCAMLVFLKILVILGYQFMFIDKHLDFWLLLAAVYVFSPSDNFFFSPGSEYSSD